MQTPGSPLNVQYNLWSTLISNSPDPLINDNGQLETVAIENLQENCTLLGINNQSFHFDVCGRSIGTLIRRATLLDDLGVLTNYTTLAVSEQHDCIQIIFVAASHGGNLSSALHCR